MPYSKRTRRYLNSAYGSVFKARKAAGYKRKSRAKISRGGVGGAVQSLSGAVVSSGAAEVKTYDHPISYISATAAWNIADSGAIAAIVQGTGAANRIGRKIKVVGIVLRLDVRATEAPDGINPYTVDVIWDNASNGAVPGVTSIYNGTARTSLPNANFNDRFIFLKRIEQSGWQQSTATTLCSRSWTMSRECHFDGNTGLIGDVEKGNLLVTCSSTDPTIFVVGVMRVLFVDM